MIEQYLDKLNGSYIDVGSNHPVLSNNSYYLYRKGWKGKLVEPLNQFNFISKFTRPRDKFLNVAISQNSRVFYEFENTNLSTTNKFVAQFYSTKNYKFAKIEVKVSTLSQLLPKSLGYEDNFVLFIDTEGSELEVLKTINWSKQLPRIIIAETWSKPWLIGNKLNKYLSNHGYELHGYTGLNGVWIHKKFLSKNRNLQAKLNSHFNQLV